MICELYLNKAVVKAKEFTRQWEGHPGLGNSTVRGLGTFGVMVATDSVSSGPGLENTSCGAWVFFEGQDEPVKNMNRRVAGRQVVPERSVCS